LLFPHDPVIAHNGSGCQGGRPGLQGIGVYFCAKVCRSFSRLGTAAGHSPRGNACRVCLRYFQYAPAGNSKCFPGGYAPPPPYLSSSGSTGTYTKTNGATLLREGEEMSWVGDTWNPGSKASLFDAGTGGLSGLCFAGKTSLVMADGKPVKLKAGTLCTIG
jgi:hypothetical protein